MHKPQESASDSDNMLAPLELHAQRRSNYIIWVTPEVAANLYNMELDTGSAVTCHSNINCCHTGEKIKPKRMLNVENKDEAHQFDLYVVKTSGLPLLGRDWE